MKPPSFDDARLVPLVSDSEIHDRVQGLIGHARSRQIWFLFLDERACQLPLMVPVDGFPSAPSPDDVEWLSGRVRDLCEACGAAAMVLVIERFASDSLTPQDLAWARALHDASDRARIPLRALLLSHRSGVRWVAQDDYRFGV